MNILLKDITRKGCAIFVIILLVDKIKQVNVLIKINLIMQGICANIATLVFIIRIKEQRNEIFSDILVNQIKK